MVTQGSVFCKVVCSARYCVRRIGLASRLFLVSFKAVRRLLKAKQRPSRPSGLTTVNTTLTLTLHAKGRIEGTPPTDNAVIGNTILRNEPDIFWDESGSGNRFAPNNCQTSVPEGPCKR
jgi:hypothetical protein